MLPYSRHQSHPVGWIDKAPAQVVDDLALGLQLLEAPPGSSHIQKIPFAVPSRAIDTLLASRGGGGIDDAKSFLASTKRIITM